MDHLDEISRLWFDPSRVRVLVDASVLGFADEEALIHLSGALANSVLTVSKTPTGVALHVRNDVVMAMVRHIELRRTETVVRNHVFQIHPDYRGKNFGARALTVQARAAQRLGFAGIELDAVGDHIMATTRHHRDRQSGYFVWPRLGFDAEIPASARRRLPFRYRHCERVSELMSTEEGQSDWFVYGETLNRARFDVTAGSASWDLLLAYCARRNIRI